VTLAELLSGPLLFVTSAAVGSLVFYVEARRPMWEWAIVLAGAGLLIWRIGLNGPPLAQAMLLGAYVTASAFAVCALAPFAARHQLSERKRLLRWIAVPPVVLFLVAVGLNVLTAQFARTTVDAQLFAADASFGLGQPAFRVSAWVLAHPLARLVAEGAYVNLPLADVLLFAALQRESREAAWRFLWLLLGVGIVGALLYPLCPGVGTIATFGPLFPNAAPAVFPIVSVPDAGWPRNCVPSVHTASGLVLLWATRSGSRQRLAATAFFVPMLVYTVVGGGHYVVDLIAAVPFTVAVEQGFNRRWAHSAASAGGFALWVVALRMDFLPRHPSIPWIFAATILLACWWLRRDVGLLLPRCRRFGRRA